MISYPLAVVNAFVAAGLCYLYFNRESYSWNPPFRATLPVAAFFFLSNVYLVIAPFIPPSDDQSVYESLPYYLHCIVGIAIIAAGGVYWLIWAIVLPRLGGYELVRERVVDDLDGWERNVFIRRPKGTSTAVDIRS